MSTYTFNHTLVTFVYSGARITGFADGTSIKIEANEDRYNLVVGADGLAARARTQNKSAKITVSLMPNSVGNRIFDAAAKLDDQTDAGALPFAITDPSIGDLYIGTAWVSKEPGREFGKDINPIEWVLETGELLAVHGSAL